MKKKVKCKNIEFILTYCDCESIISQQNN